MNEEVEALAWKLFQRRLGLRFKRELTAEQKKEITDVPEYQIYRDKAQKIFDKKEQSKNDVNAKKYPIIEVPASGKPNWSGGARTMCFIYSKRGNYIVRGFHKEVMEYIKRNFTHYFMYVSMWDSGMSRGHWKFWKDNVTIFDPGDLNKKDHKFTVMTYKGNRYGDDVEKVMIKFKRLPKRWIPEFEKL